MNKRVKKEFDKYLDVPFQSFDVDETPFGSDETLLERNRKIERLSKRIEEQK